KPANILIDSEGHPHVTDFGLARRIDSDLELTASGAIMGTPAYMSPEQAAGRRGSITTATDVYGLGAILYALLASKAPVGGDSLVDTLQAVKERPPESPRNHNANVPRDLETICLKCLAKDPRRRYASAQALADDLRCWLDSRPIAARRVGPAERAGLWCKRKPAVAAVATSVMLAGGRRPARNLRRAGQGERRPALGQRQARPGQHPTQIVQHPARQATVASRGTRKTGDRRSQAIPRRRGRQPRPQEQSRPRIPSQDPHEGAPRLLPVPPRQPPGRRRHQTRVHRQAGRCRA